jgi:hypothetical protein
VLRKTLGGEFCAVRHFPQKPPKMIGPARMILDGEDNGERHGSRNRASFFYKARRWFGVDYDACTANERISGALAKFDAQGLKYLVV